MRPWRPCPRFPFATEFDARFAPHSRGRAVVYRCPCGSWHKARTVKCRSCGAPIVSDAGRGPVDPSTGLFHPCHEAA